MSFKTLIPVLALAFVLGFGGTAYAQTTGTDTTGGATVTSDPGTTVPGTPNTGDGGMAPINLAVLAGTGAIAIIAAAYAIRAQRR